MNVDLYLASHIPGYVFLETNHRLHMKVVLQTENSRVRIFKHQILAAACPEDFKCTNSFDLDGKCLLQTRQETGEP